MHGNLDQSDAFSPEQFLPEPLPASPFPIFRQWFDEAHARKVQPNPNAMTLSTVDADGRISGRVVLCKAIDVASGSLLFYTNYLGRKGRALAAHPRAALTFHWDVLDRQVRMEGVAVRATQAESDTYFASRPWASRIGAWTSDQSEPVSSRAALEAKLDATLRRFGIDPDNLPAKDAKIEIPRPAHWGGFRFIADRVELWLGSSARLHDRAEWVRTLASASPDVASLHNVVWRSTRLQP